MENKELPIFVENRESWKEEYGSYEKRYNKIAFDIKNILKIINLKDKKLKILDAGCSYGYHLKLLNSINPNLDLTGIELSKDASQEAKKLNVAKIINQSLIDKFQFKDNSFDLIYSLDVVEHLNNKEEFNKFLGEVSRVLKKGGLLIIKTPAMTFTSWLAALLSLNLKKYYTDDHKLHFNEKKMKESIPKGFIIAKIFYTSNSENKILNILFNLLHMHHMWTILKK